MIDYENKETLIIDSLQDWLSKKGHNCPVVIANQCNEIPNHPYISCTITTPVMSDTSHYSIATDGTRYKSIGQVWSFTIQSNDDIEATNISLEAYDWFALIGNTYLSDNNIVVLRVGNVGNRDNLLTTGYEYRKGFDVEFTFVHEISKADSEQGGYIETAEIKH